jgi:hypothetical protein
MLHSNSQIYQRTLQEHSMSLNSVPCVPRIHYLSIMHDGVTTGLNGPMGVLGMRSGSERADSYWRVSGGLDVAAWLAHGYSTCGAGERGAAINNRTIIRLQHVTSGKWLHSGWHDGHMCALPCYYTMRTTILCALIYYTNHQ